MLQNKTIGLVSGIGPLAGFDVLKKIYDYAAEKYGAHQDEEYPDVIMFNHGIGVDALANDSPAFHDGVVEMVKQLETWGANIIGIACNTAHIYYNDLKPQRDTQVINLIDEVAKVAKKAAPNATFGLLSSRGTRDQKLYHNYLDRHGVAFTEANDQQQKLLDKTIDLVMAHREKQAARFLHQVIYEMAKTGVSRFILGCTELPIAFDSISKNSRSKYENNLIDANRILASCLVDRYMEGGLIHEKTN
ncbi:amino acid racemase [Candidatus Saccharibacteria bacterium]|nr:amino acid racemase [Candidatus Saccharibacteria bacterium]